MLNKILNFITNPVGPLSNKREVALDIAHAAGARDTMTKVDEEHIVRVDWGGGPTDITVTLFKNKNKLCSLTYERHYGGYHVSKWGVYVNDDGLSDKQCFALLDEKMSKALSIRQAERDEIDKAIEQRMLQNL